MEKSSFQVIWEFLAPDEERFSDRLEACQRLWASLPISKQRQIYATLVWMREQKVEINENPYFAISNCNPQPFNYSGAKCDLPTDKKLFIAKYKGLYGVYSKLDTEAFLMTDLRPF